MVKELLLNQNYYDLFGVSPDAPIGEIKLAYARLIREYTNEHSPEQFMHIRQAYTTLSNLNTREQYDRQISQYEHEEDLYESSIFQLNEQSTYEERPYYNPVPKNVEELNVNPVAVDSDYSVFGNVIFSIILSFILTPVVGIIAGIVIHVMRIPIWKYTLGLAGCLIVIIIIVLVGISLIFG